jgi:CBS domain containing-hemolysin-like protein
VTWVLSLLVGIVVVLVITIATGYFVAQEFAYMAVDRSRLAALSERGNAQATRALSVTRRTSFMLSGAQLGITVTALLTGYVAEPLIGEAIGEAAGGSAVAVTIGTVAALLFATFVQMLFGELFPKNLAIARPEPVALWLARSTTIYLAVFGWLVRIFDAASNLLLRLLRIEPVHDVEHSATVRDLEHIVADSRASGNLPPDLSMLLDRILDFPRQDVEHAMIPRSRVDVVHDDEEVGRLRELMAVGHSRYPVVDADDGILGVVHMTDLLMREVPDGTLASELQRDALVLPTTMALPDALRELAATNNEMACVIDEYGGFAGVLTLEDLAEELVGEITDEHDTEEPPYAQADDDGVWIMAGDVHVDEVERAIDHDLPEGDWETIAGLVIAEHGSLPEVGDVVDVDIPMDPADLALDDPPPITVMRVEVTAIERHVPSQVKVTLDERPAPTDTKDDDEGDRHGHRTEQSEEAAR